METVTTTVRHRVPKTTVTARMHELRASSILHPELVTVIDYETQAYLVGVQGDVDPVLMASAVTDRVYRHMANEDKVDWENPHLVALTTATMRSIWNWFED